MSLERGVALNVRDRQAERVRSMMLGQLWAELESRGPVPNPIYAGVRTADEARAVRYGGNLETCRRLLASGLDWNEASASMALSEVRKQSAELRLGASHFSHLRGPATGQ